MFTGITRGDLRQHMRRSEVESRIWKYIHCHPSEIRDLICNETIDDQTIVSEILLLADMFQCMDDSLIQRINLIYPLIIDSTILQEETEEQLILLIREFKQKFEMKMSTE